MARAKKRTSRSKEREPAEPDDEEEDEEEDDDDDDAWERDFVLARIASARNALQASLDGLDEMVAHFNNPDDDPDGKERCELLDGAVEQVGFATRALEAAEEVIEDVDWEQGEPWDGE